MRSRLAGESPRDYVQRLARAKALAGVATGGAMPVLGADTTVAIGDEIFAKPDGRGGRGADARRIVRADP